MISSFLNWDKKPGLYGLKFAEILGCSGLLEEREEWGKNIKVNNWVPQNDTST